MPGADFVVHLTPDIRAGRSDFLISLGSKVTGRRGQRPPLDQIEPAIQGACWLLANVSLGRADAGAQVPTNFAMRVTRRDVVEISMVRNGIGQLVVHHGELRHS
jgi:hypothetical protein